MLPILLEILISFFLIVIGLIYILKNVIEHKVGKEIWALYREISGRTDLELMMSLSFFSNWPDLRGEIKGKKVYVHPHKGSRRKNRAAKTIFGVENDIDLEGDIIIVPSSTLLSPEDYEFELDVPTLDKNNYNVYSQSRLDEEKIDDMFTKKISHYIHKLIEKNQEDFRAIILEPGIIMFSDYGLTLEKDRYISNLEELTEIVFAMEKNLGPEGTNEDFINTRIEKLIGESRTGIVKTMASLVLLGTAVVFLFQITQDFSFLLMNAGVLALIIGVLNIYIISDIGFKYT